MRSIGDAGELEGGRALAFDAFAGGAQRACFALRTARGLRAWVNVCAHRARPVVEDDHPLGGEGLLECRSHGARYDPATGVCVEGPCPGARLTPVALVERDGALWVEDDLAIDDSLYAGGNQ